MEVSKQTILFWLIIFLLTCNSFAVYGQNHENQSFQDSINYYLKSARKFTYIDFDSAAFNYNKAADFLSANKAWKDYCTVISFKTQSASYNFEIDSLRDCITLLEENLPKFRQDTTDYAYKLKVVVIRYWGSYYYKIGDLNRALDKFTELDKFIVDNGSEGKYSYKFLVQNYVNIGKIHSVKGNQELAIQYFQYAIKAAGEYRERYKPDYSDTYIYRYIANAYVKKGEYVEGLRYHKKVNDFYRKSKERSNKQKNTFLNSYNDIAQLYLETNQPDSALLYLNESLQYHIEDDPFYPTTYLNIAKAYTQKGDYDKAEEYIDKALKDTQNRYGNKHYKTAEVHLEKGNIYRKKQDLKEALKHYQKSIISLVDRYNDTSIQSLPANTDVNNKRELLLALQAKANTFHALWLQDENIKNLKHANAHIQLTINLMDDMRREYSSEEARRFLVDQNYPVFEKGIEINRQLYLQTNDKNYLTEAFRMAEKSKSLSLLDALKNADAQQFANIPENTLEQERQLRVQMNHLKGKISKLKKETKNEASLRDLQNELFEQQQQYDDFVASLETEYPDYHELKYGQSIAGVDDIRRDMLTEDAVFVEYFMGDEQLYTFFITQDNIHVFSTKNTEQIQTNIATLRQAIKDKNDPSYVQTAHFLYQNLLEKGLEKIGENVERIIVVPDGGLAYIPFDILLENKIEVEGKVNYRKSVMPYLLNSYAISYAYSATVLQQNLSKEKSSKTAHDFAGFAPDFGYLSDTNIVMRSCHDNRLSVLQNTKKEVTAIRQLIGGKTFAETAATKDNFEHSGTKSRIIHLSTHACADEDDQLSRIYFNDDEYMTALELYSLPLEADMVVLSACETGIGTLRRGEGVMSLARAFAYTGVPATTMSLWKVEDRATSEIMINYYKHLKSGKTKDQALRFAKLDFLEPDNHAEDKYLHPYYWAAFVHIGNAEALTFGTNWWLWLSVLALVLGAISIRRLYRTE